MGKLKERITVFLTETLPYRQYRSEFKNRAVRWYRLLFYTIRGVREHKTTVRCAALTFYTLVSVVPMLAVVFAVIKGFGFIDTVIDSLYGLFPQIPEIVDYIVDFAERRLVRTSGGVMAVFGAGVLFWSAFSVFNSVEDAFNRIWEVQSSRSFVKYPVYITILIAVPLMCVAGSGLSGFIEELGLADSATEFLSQAVSIIVIWLIFTTLYCVIPNTSVKFSNALIAGIAAGTAFAVFQWAYVNIQQWTTSYNAIYGSFAALPLFLMWLRYSWLILLSGGELAFARQNIDKFDEAYKLRSIGSDSSRKITLAAMTVVVKRFMEGAGAVTAAEVAQMLDLPQRAASRALNELVHAGQLAETMPKEEDDIFVKGYIPARNVSEFTVYGVVEAVDNTGRPLDEIVSEGAVMRLSEEWERLKVSGRRSPDNRRIADIAAEIEIPQPANDTGR